jgi:hypothetical protein
VIAGLALGAFAGPARGHVAPSVEENNRYIKVTVFADRVRLAYILFMGEVPGRATRERLDADRDGVVSDREAHRFRDEWAARVAGALDIELGGAPAAPRWSIAEVGLGDRRTSSGAFSLDLVAWLCPDSGAPLRLDLRDRLRLPLPGESELLIEESPGTEITLATLAGDPGTRFRWTGAGGPIEKGLVLSWRADADAPRDPGACAAAIDPPAKDRRGWWLLVLGGAGLAVLAAAAAIAFRVSSRR